MVKCNVRQTIKYILNTVSKEKCSFYLISGMSFYRMNNVCAGNNNWTRYRFINRIIVSLRVPLQQVSTFSVCPQVIENIVLVGGVGF